MQFLVTVNDPENGLGNTTERSLTEQIESMVGIWDRMPGIVATLETHEEDVYGYASLPKCEICGEPDGPGEPDWNGETGQHLSCERDLMGGVYATDIGMDPNDPNHPRFFGGPDVGFS